MAENEVADGPSVEHDVLFTHIAARHHEEGERSSDASESADKTTKFLDETGLNGKAVNHIGGIVKTLKKKDGQQKAMDIIRSLEIMLPMAKNHVEGQGTGEMDLNGPDDETEDEDQVDAAGDETDVPDDVDGADGSTVTPLTFGDAS